jgi:hypothetical protein
MFGLRLGIWVNRIVCPASSAFGKSRTERDHPTRNVLRHLHVFFLSRSFRFFFYGTVESKHSDIRSFRLAVREGPCPCEQGTLAAWHWRPWPGQSDLWLVWTGEANTTGVWDLLSSCRSCVLFLVYLCRYFCCQATR